MKKRPTARKLREHPDLDQLKRQAKELLTAFLANDAGASAEVKAHYSGAEQSKFALHDAQLVLARSYGFDSWPKLKAYVDGATAQRLAALICAGDKSQVRTMLTRRPELADMAMSYGDERRPLHYAVMKREPEIVRLLMQLGADARKGVHPHRDATAALTIARERGYGEIVAIVEDEEQHRRETTRGCATTANTTQDDLNALIANSNYAQALALLEANPSLIYSRDRDGWTPLHMAAAARSPEVVAWLVEHGAGPNRARKGRPNSARSGSHSERVCSGGKIYGRSDRAAAS